MTDGMAILAHGKPAAAAIFFACAIATMGVLVALSVWTERAEHKNGRRIALSVAAAVFLALFAAGGYSIFLEGHNFIDMTLMMFGLAGLVVLPATMRQAATPDSDAERRHMAAHDL